MTEVNNEYDEIIFDYLEGNLSENERSAFEILLSANRELSEQVRQWKNTYVLAPFPITKDLETTIAASYNKRKWTLSLNTFIFILLITLSTSIPIRINEAVVPYSEMDIARVEERIQPKIQPDKKIEDTKISYRQSENRAEKIDVPQMASPRIVQKDIIIPTPNTDDLVRSLVLENRITQILTAQTAKSSFKKLSRHEMKELNRKKRKADNFKSEIEFLKGNVPYVVPLDINNF